MSKNNCRKRIDQERQLINAINEEMNRPHIDTVRLAALMREYTTLHVGVEVRIPLQPPTDSERRAARNLWQQYFSDHASDFPDDPTST
jgi:hypothetical protein